MKKTLTIILILVIVCLVSIFVSACDNDVEGEILPPTTHQINNENDFRALEEKTGLVHSNATFSLNSDLDLSSENWEGIGLSSDISQAFTGIFEGNGHSITYKIQITPPLENVFEHEERQAFGLFSYANNAKFRNLNVIVNLEIPCEAQYIYVGGLCAFLSGDSSLENVNVSGTIETTMRDLRQDIVTSDGSIIKPPMGGQENNKYFDLCAGGVVGYSKGNLSYTDVNSETSVTINRNKYCILNTVNVGGIAGLIRPVDISGSNSSRILLNNLAYEGNMTFYGGNVYAGGIAGSIHHSDMSSVFVGNTNPANFSGNALGRLSFGLITGLLEHSSIEKGRVIANTVSVSAISTSRKVSFNVGGIAGMLKNSVLSFCTSEIDFEVRNGTYFYGGGIAGVCYDSDINNAVATGEISILSSGQIKSSILDYDFKYTMATEDLSDFSKNAKNGGIVGRVEGQCKLADLSSEFKSFQPLFGETAVRLEIVILKKGKTFLDQWIEDAGYDSNLMLITETYSEDAEEDEQQYTINHFYQVDDNLELTYRKTNSKMCLDRIEWQLAARNLENTELGSGQTDTIAYTDLKNKIDSAID